MSDEDDGRQSKAGIHSSAIRAKRGFPEFWMKGGDGAGSTQHGYLSNMASVARRRLFVTRPDWS